MATMRFRFFQLFEGRRKQEWKAVKLLTVFECDYSVVIKVAMFSVFEILA